MMTKAPEEYGLWKRMKCVLFHAKHKVWISGHHSWAFSCSKCGLVGEIDD